jgi:deoxycytidylate deaminase
MEFRQNTKEATEIVIGIIGPIGCNREFVIETISKIAKHYSYESKTIGLSKIIIKHCSVPDPKKDQHKRVNDLMTAGSELRGRTKDNSILAKLAAVEIQEERKKQPTNKTIYIINSIKHPEEVEELRNIYGFGFYLFAVHSSESSRESYLKNHCLINDKTKREQLINRDKDEKIGHGQSTSEAFHLADFFLLENGNNTQLWNVIERFFDLIFGNPFKTPTFHEYSMYMAYAAATRSADMSRQVGAVITRNKDIISTGANECPSAEDGTYWPIFDTKTHMITDKEGGRDYTNNIDRNGKEKNDIIEALKQNIPDDILETLIFNINQSGINDITEYGRVVHAEMDAILGCARRGVSTKETIMFCSTHPCHNCAKHIIASGIKQVVYIEPYPKSKAIEMHSDAICVPDDKSKENKVLFSPFIGVGPRIMVNLFSLSLSAGEKIRRKKSGSFQKAEWNKLTARPRLKAFSATYLKNENTVKKEAEKSLSKIKKIVV